MDYYKILDVNKNANEQEIKKAYKKLAFKYHPDRNKDANASDKFKEVSEAYAVLSDPQKRKMYEQYGEAGVHQNYSQEDIFRGANFDDIFSSFRSRGGGDPFSSIFGSMFRGGVRRQRDVGQSHETTMEITLEDVAKGVERKLKYKKLEVCPKCQGQGGTNVQTCQTCHGRGAVRQTKRMGPMQFVTETVCPECHGQGKSIKNKCTECRGMGKIEKIEDLTVNIPKGIENGMTINLEGMGDYGKDGYGDVFVHVRVKPHKYFKRHGKDLLIERNIDIAQAVLGDNIQIKDIEENDVNIKIPTGTQSGAVIRAKGHGIPELHGGKGDLNVKVNVKIPKDNNISSELKKELKHRINKKDKFLGFI